MFYPVILHFHGFCIVTNAARIPIDEFLIAYFRGKSRPRCVTRVNRISQSLPSSLSFSFSLPPPFSSIESQIRAQSTNFWIVTNSLFHIGAEARCFNPESCRKLVRSDVRANYYLFFFSPFFFFFFFTPVNGTIFGRNATRRTKRHAFLIVSSPRPAIVKPNTG